MSPDLNWDDALKAHPEWAMRDSQGAVSFSREDPRLFRTCMFSTYMTDYIPAVIREVNSRYDVDALYTNGWPPIGTLPVCYCEECKELPAPGTPAYWDHFNQRVFSLRKMYDGISKEKKPANFYFANLGGGAHATPNMSELGKICTWFHADNQGRVEDEPIWGGSLQGRACNAVQDGKWVAAGEAPFIVEGDGLIEAIAWETEAGFALHLLNYTNPNTHRGWTRRSYPLGEQKISMKIPAGSRVDRVELLRVEHDVPFKTTGRGVEFVIPRIDDYEVAAIHRS